MLLCLNSPSLRTLTAAVALVFSLVSVHASEPADSIKTEPDLKTIIRQAGLQYEFHGVVRGRFEWNTYNGLSRFQARNARLSAGVKVGKAVQAFIQADFCDRGKVKMLDAWGQLNLPAAFNVRIGQFRIPFGDNSFSAPATYWFANRSFVNKYLSPGRHVGMQVGYSVKNVPLKAYAGVFNAYSISDHEVWSTKYNYAGRLVYTPGQWQIVAGFVSALPDSARINSWNLGATFSPGRWRFEAEYLCRHYTGHALSASHGYLVQADYHHPMPYAVFNQWSAQLRVDGMTNYWSGSRNAKGMAVYDKPLRNRITGGVTLSHVYTSKIGAHLRLNYEKYLYGHNHPSGADNDKLVAELVVTF